MPLHLSSQCSQWKTFSFLLLWLFSILSNNIQALWHLESLKICQLDQAQDSKVFLGSCNLELLKWCKFFPSCCCFCDIWQWKHIKEIHQTNIWFGKQKKSYKKKNNKTKIPEIPQEIFVPCFDTIFRHNLVNHKW